jgi:hypothetical protein
MNEEIFVAQDGALVLADLMMCGKGEGSHKVYLGVLGPVLIEGEIHYSLVLYM